MAMDPNTQERIYQMLKREYLDGAHLPGARLEIQGMADRCRASTTPVREAIHRLIGERLLETSPEGGVRVTLLEGDDLAQLYEWNAQHILAALRLADSVALREKLRPFLGASLNTAMDRVARVSAIFTAIGSSTGNREFAAQIGSANARLLHARLAEQRVLSDQERELATFLRNGRIDVRSNLRRRIIAYHRRRIQHVDEIARALHAASKS
ncbi:GntR family transcriptional regulator [Sphingomonas koreensis]